MCIRRSRRPAALSSGWAMRQGGVSHGFNSSCCLWSKEEQKRAAGSQPSSFSIWRTCSARLASLPFSTVSPVRAPLRQSSSSFCSSAMRSYTDSFSRLGLLGARDCGEIRRRIDSAVIVRVAFSQSVNQRTGASSRWSSCTARSAIATASQY